MVMRYGPSLFALALGLLALPPASAQRFFPDDPLESELPPLNTPEAAPRTLSPVLNYFTNSFTRSGEQHPSEGVIVSQGVNTLGEVMDGQWYVNRHAKTRMSRTELQRGPGNAFPPSRDTAWDVLIVRSTGYRTGMLIEDSQERQYLLRFDPVDYLEMSTAAEMIGSRFIHALGYWTPEDYLVYFDRSELQPAPGGREINSMGALRALEDEDIDEFLDLVAVDPERGYRAVATRVPDGVSLGPFQFHGTRADDVNDLFRHEHRRDLRGLFVFSAFLNNIRTEADATLDLVIQEDAEGEPRQFIRHYLIDFQSTLGSELDRPKMARDGNDPAFSADTVIRNFFSFGIAAEPWMSADYPDLPAVGRFECQTFDPFNWSPRYKPAPFANQLPDDRYWGAKILMAFTDDDIRAIVETGGYSDPAAQDWVANCLIERRDRIGRAFLEEVLPLDNFRVEDETLLFDDLSVVHGFREARAYQVFWSTFDNVSGASFAIADSTGFTIPDAMLDADPGTYFVGGIGIEGDGIAVDVEQGVRTTHRVEVYLRRETSGFSVVGIDRIWPGKVVVQPRAEAPRATTSRYDTLTERQRELFDSYAALYSQQTGFEISAPEYWEVMSISERTTFDAVTQAMESTELTDMSGASLGNALELCTAVERVAGQYSGLGGDQQFRVYCTLRPDAQDVIEASQEFTRGHENTVYHVGFPISYRQGGDPPTMQFSMAEDGSRADIDVDYRSSGMPASMWNGHLTSANSDVRVPENLELHNQRWAGFSAWWEGVFGNFRETETELMDLISRRPPPDPLDLPPDRGSGAVPAEVWEASQEFLTDWLQRRNYAEASEFLSDQSLRCIGQGDGEIVIILTPGQARGMMRDLLRGVAVRLGDIENLIEAIEGVEPWRRDVLTIVDHPFRRAFSIFSMGQEVTEQFICDGNPAIAGAADAAAALTDTGTYHGSLFRFRFGRDLGGTLGLIWAREDGDWKIVSYVVFRE